MQNASNDSAIVMMSLAVLLISAKGKGRRQEPIYRDSSKNPAGPAAVTGKRRVQSHCI